MLESGLRPTLWHSCVVDIPVCGNKCLREGRASVAFAFREFLSDICTPSTWTAVFKKEKPCIIIKKVLRQYTDRVGFVSLQDDQVQYITKTFGCIHS